MIRLTARALCAASLVIAPLTLSSPAQAATSCTVNGVPVTSGTVNGTAGSDFIQCSTVNAGDTVNGLGGNDYIVVTGDVNGTVRGGAGGDYVQVNNVSPSGQVSGDSENDFLRAGLNLGLVNGGTGFDVCRVSGGNTPLSCEV
ncbi:hypothetical protein ABZS88_17885 [Streptomyces sp. NPDC005480]|uniref:hypothetical protein n=1 Tax=Streptomyces sp. NPDC005480 TaxID=3154880 RepID=UPI0033BA4A9A